MKLFGISLLKAIRKVGVPKVKTKGQLSLFDQQVELFGGETKQFGENDTRRFDKEKGRWVDADNDTEQTDKQTYEITQDEFLYKYKTINGKKLKLLEEVYEASKEDPLAEENFSTQIEAFKKEAREVHKQEVEWALEENKKVYKGWEKDYPELQHNKTDYTLSSDFERPVESTEKIPEVNNFEDFKRNIAYEDHGNSIAVSNSFGTLRIISKERFNTMSGKDRDRLLRELYKEEHGDLAQKEKEPESANYTALPNKPTEIKTHKDMMQYAKSYNLDLSLISEKDEEDLIARLKKDYKKNQLPANLNVDKAVQHSIYKNAEGKKPEELSLYAYATREFIESAKFEFQMMSSALWVSPNSYRDNHKKAIEKALQEGKDVPIKILHEYPDLKSKYKSISLPAVEGLTDGFSTEKEPDENIINYIPSTEFARSLYMKNNGMNGMYELKEKVPIDDIKFDKNRLANANPIYDETVQTIMDNFDPDQFNPVTIDTEGYLRDGQHRLEVAKRKGLKFIDAVINNAVEHEQIDLSWLDNDELNAKKKVEYGVRDFKNIDSSATLTDEQKAELKAKIWNEVRSYTGGTSKTLWQRALLKDFPVVRSGNEVTLELSVEQFGVMLKEIDEELEENMPESEKMRRKVESAIQLQEKMKNANAIIKKKGLTDQQRTIELGKLGFNNSSIEKLMKPDFAGRIGFADYQLRNNNANIRRMEMRVMELKKKENQSGEHELQESKLKDGRTAKLVRNHELDRVQLFFDGIPDGTIRNRLKSRGWKWSPKNSAWQRMNTDNSVRDAEQFLREFGEGEK